jgi:hypothetical protein
MEAADRMSIYPWVRRRKKLEAKYAVKPRQRMSGYRFTLKGSPRHYDDVKAIIEAEGTAQVYFGEALAYERGAGIALWRIRAEELGWLNALYDWWVEMERVEPIQFTFYLYLPDNLKYPALDLRAHSPQDVAAFIEANAPWEDEAIVGKPTQLSKGQPSLSSH